MYINNSKIYSGEVPSGPFTLNQLPQLSGGDVRLVTRDSSGNEQVVKAAYYYSPDLIRRHLFDYSAELGFLRYGYGVRNFDYGDLAGTASARYGVTDNTTLEGHIEGSRSFGNVGAGINQRLGGIGVLELAAAISSYEGETGEKITGQIQTLIHGVSAYVGGEQRFGQYFDLGRVSVFRNPAVNLSGTDVYEQLLASTLGARTLMRAGIGGQLPFDRKTNVSIGYTGLRSDTSDYDLLNFSISRSLGGGFGLLVNGYQDLGVGTSTVMLGLTKSLGNVTTMVSGQRSDGRTSLDFQASGSRGNRQNAFNWSLLDRETEGGEAFRMATVGYRLPQACAQASVQQQGGDTRVVGQLSGSIIAAGGEVRPVNRVGSSFVLVRNAGPDAAIMQDNVLMGRTDSAGSAFLPDSQPFRPVSISIDPTNVPVGWQVDETQKRVVTGWQNGAVVDFKARKVASAIVRLVDDKGKAIEPGYVLKLDGGKDVLIGYGGEAYVEGIAPDNHGLIDLGVAGVCRVSFAYKPDKGQVQPVIGPVACTAAAQ